MQFCVNASDALATLPNFRFRPSVSLLVYALSVLRTGHWVTLVFVVAHSVGVVLPTKLEKPAQDTIDEISLFLHFTLPAKFSRSDFVELNIALAISWVYRKVLFQPVFVQSNRTKSERMNWCADAAFTLLPTFLGRC